MVARRRARLLALFAVAALFVGCSTSESRDTTATTSGDTVEAPETVSFDETTQAELAAVGCYSGPGDPVVGPGTDAAVVAFQQARGLTVDGEPGPETLAALRDASAKGEQVCDDPPPTSAPVPTSTSVPTTSAPCTASAIGSAIAPATVRTYRCSDGFAAGAEANPEFDSAYLLRAEGGSWVRLDTTGEACAPGNPLGIPETVLVVAPCRVS